MVKYRYLRNERGVNTGEITNRIFKNEMGITLKDYVTRRKLVKASEKIVSGYRVIDAALQYGWETHAGFTKAFKKGVWLQSIFFEVYVK